MSAFGMPGKMSKSLDRTVQCQRFPKISNSSCTKRLPEPRTRGCSLMMVRLVALSGLVPVLRFLVTTVIVRVGRTMSLSTCICLSFDWKGIERAGQTSSF